MEQFNFGPARSQIEEASQQLSGLMSAEDKAKLDNISQSTLREIPFVVGVSDWSLSDGMYSAEVVTSYVTTTSKNLVTFDASVRNYAKGDISADRKNDGGGIVLTTAVIPTGNISGTIYVIDNDDGKVPILVEETVMPIANGGTGASSVAGAQANLGIDQKITNPSGIGNNKFLRTDSTGVIVWGDQASGTEIANQVTAWLNDHVSGGTTIALDDTLTIAGAASDSAKVGEEIGELKSEISDLETVTNDIPKTRDSDATGVDLDVSDTNGNVLVRFSGGHIKTKNFNSENTFPFPAPIDSDADLAISDINGNALALFRDGQIQTKRFDSKYIRQLTGKKWACLGDSLTEHNQRTTLNYHDYIATETGITVFNLGHSGCGYAKVGGNGQNFVNQAENIPNDTNVITIFGSGNDGSAGLEIGTPTDSGNTTLCGYINATIDTIYANHPVTPLGIITPTPWATKEPSDGETWMKSYSEAIIAICTLRGIPYLDLWHCSNLHPSDVNFRPLAYSKDDGNGVHPDETGHALIAPRIRQFLFSLI